MIGLTGILKFTPENSRNYIVIDSVYGDDAKATLNPYKRDSFFKTFTGIEDSGVVDYVNPITIVVHPGTYELDLPISFYFLTLICVGSPTIRSQSTSVVRFGNGTYNAANKLYVLGDGIFESAAAVQPVFFINGCDAYIQCAKIKKTNTFYGGIFGQNNCTVYADVEEIDCSTNLGNALTALFGCKMTVNCRVAKFSWIGILVQDHLSSTLNGTVINFNGDLEAYDYSGDTTRFATTFLLADETGNATINFNGRMIDKKTITDTGLFGAVYQSPPNSGEININGGPSVLKTVNGILKRGTGRINMNSDIENTQGVGAVIQGGIFRISNATLKTSFASAPKDGIDYSGGNVVLDNAKIVVNNPASAFSITPNTSRNIKIYNAYANAPVSTAGGTLTNLITGGTLIVDSDVE